MQLPAPLQRSAIAPTVGVVSDGPGASRFEQRKQESRRRILDAALDLFLEQGVQATTLQEVCSRADVADRTFFNHFPTRDDMVRALADRRLEGLDVLLAGRLDAGGATVPALVVALFDDLAAHLEAAGPEYRALVGEMLRLSWSSTGGGTARTAEPYGSFLRLLKEGVVRGEVTDRHDPLTLTDIVVGTLVAVLLGWASDDAFALSTALHDAGLALADLLTPEP
jgi:AcrR family transcriptional regulator